MDQLMLDIETMGTKSYSAILSIGAVEFNIETGETGKEFYHNVDLQSCIDLGLKIDGDTVMWWMKQSKEAQESLLKNREPIIEVLKKFADFIGDKNYEVWGNSASFDCGLLKNAYYKANLEAPWKYYNERCVRTLSSFAPGIKYNYPKPEIAHNAIEDCKYQIGYCSKIWRVLKSSKSVDKDKAGFDHIPNFVF